LSNIGTWFIGRLQTSQDIDRIIDGLDGKVGSNFDRGEIKKVLSSMPKRTFLLKSAHLDDIRLFATRWVMSYLKGPLKKGDISTLMTQQKSLMTTDTPLEISTDDGEYESYNALDNSIAQHYEIDPTGTNRYRASIVANVEVSFFNQSRGIDEKEIETLELILDSSYRDIDWGLAEVVESDFMRLPTQKPNEAKLKKLPQFIYKDKRLRDSSKALSDWLYHERRLELFRNKSPKLESKPYETLGDFKVRLQDILNEKKDIEIDKLKERYSRKEQTLQDRLNRALQRVEKEQSDVSSKTTDTMISAGMAVLGALFGSRSTAKIGTTLSKGSRILKEKGDVDRANQRVQEAQEKLDDLLDELDEKIDRLDERYDIDSCNIENFTIKPRRSDIQIDEIAIVWRVV
jgi:uncharacterized protein (DUF2267 family)